MEKQLEERIRAFLAVSSGSGSGDGDGDGFGSGYGYGSGDGYGSGSGDGSGSSDGSGSGDGDGFGSGYGYGYGDGYGSGHGSGHGSGDGSDIPEFNDQKVWQIDGMPTIIDSVHDTYAKGRILNSDFTLTPCFVAKVDNCFAHGDTLRKAFDDATAKSLEKMPLEERIARFKEQFPDPDVKISARQLYEWHHTLTGSCEVGRNHFAREHGINIDTDSFTIREFVTLTINHYGSSAIMELNKTYGGLLENQFKKE